MHDDDDKAKRAESYLVNPSPPPKYPGLVGTELNTNTGKFLIYDGGWHSGVDSFLEVGTTCHSHIQMLAEPLVPHQNTHLQANRQHDVDLQGFLGDGSGFN